MKDDRESSAGSATPCDGPDASGWLSRRLPDWPRIRDACLRRTRSWPVPPGWTASDWRAELESEWVALACKAVRDFDPSRGPAPGSFIYHRILSSALARYRREREHPEVLQTRESCSP